MKICIVGAGAIGGWLSAKLIDTGAHQVSVLARGETLSVLKTEGWWLQTAEGLIQAPVHMASDDANELGAQDLVIIAVKGQSLADIAPKLAPLLHDETLIMPAMNGVPWWFCQGIAGLDGPLQSLDPTGVIQASIPQHQVIGCVVHASTSQQDTGYIRHFGGQKLIVGEPLGGTSDRLTLIASVLSQAGFDAVISSNIRHDIWYKLWGNMTMNPVSAITGATIDKILGDPLVRSFCTDVMLEAQIIGAHIGCPIHETPEDRHAVTAKLGAFKTSMLQDVQAKRSLELDGIVAAVQEIGRRLNLPTPNIDALLGLTRLMGQIKHLYPT